MFLDPDGTYLYLPNDTYTAVTTDGKTKQNTIKQETGFNDSFLFQNKSILSPYYLKNHIIGQENKSIMIDQTEAMSITTTIDQEPGGPLTSNISNRTTLNASKHDTHDKSTLESTTIEAGFEESLWIFECGDHRTRGEETMRKRGPRPENWTTEWLI